MKVLVMGGTRFNGLALVNELVQHGHEQAERRERHLEVRNRGSGP